MVTIKSERELELMEKAGNYVAQVLDELTEKVYPGVSTQDLDFFAEQRCRDLGVIPAFKGYHGFPGCLCISVNDEVVHGIPSSKRILNEGDVVGIDFGVIYQGWFGDSARTFPVGKISSEAVQLLDVTKESLHRGIEQCREGNRLFDIGHAVQNYVEKFGYSVVREFVGHGIGRALHEDPQVPNFGAKGKGMELKAGMVLAIEPMVNAGGPAVQVLEDGWTAVTRDRSLSAHFEHTVAITADGPRILTPVGVENASK
ncbi:MAG: type I methionyl aminopeptidase [Bdellovibrionaceae bacterium]|nr:type I methionyl aminopeptidase [Pseudobdellovibrionaceae bacterium]|tara:strand:- start:1111 stop:1881 length:771 start_codon:yes stop_codon:yes gene_type:complete